ncbi:MAG: methyltransferase domain-containing protein [Patescibacteria group bacterium]|jgi:SAM-dependent methyltransferase
MHKAFDFVREVLRGKTIYRILFNWEVQKHCRNLSGEVLDLASGGLASYYRYLPKNTKLIRTDYRPGKDIDLVVDLNRPLPLPDNQYQNILLFNAINILVNTTDVFKEINRILTVGGKLFLSSLFIANEMPEPHDFNRLTYEGIMKQLTAAGFSRVEIYRIGERATAATHIMAPFYPFSFIRLFIYPMAILLDRLISKSVRTKYPCPIGYFVIAQK